MTRNHCPVQPRPPTVQGRWAPARQLLGLQAGWASSEPGCRRCVSGGGRCCWKALREEGGGQAAWPGPKGTQRPHHHLAGTRYECSTSAWPLPE